MSDNHTCVASRLARRVASILVLAALVLALGCSAGARGGTSPGTGAPNLGPRSSGPNDPSRSSPGAGDSALIPPYDERGELTGAFLETARSRFDTVTVDEARSRADFELRLPDARDLPSGQGPLIATAGPSGEKGTLRFGFFYGGGLQLTIEQSTVTPAKFVAGRLADWYNPDLAEPEVRASVWARTAVGGNPAIWRDAHPQRMASGLIKRVPAALIWQSPDGSPSGRYVRYILFGWQPTLNKERLLAIAQNMK